MQSNDDEALEQMLINLRRKIHKHPEIRFTEYSTCDLIEKTLNDFGIETRRFEDCTGVIGTIHGCLNGEQVVAVRADIDALPLQEKSGLPFVSQNDGTCHACGHDLHTTALLGCAYLLKQFQSQLAGTVRLIFQPAEEGQGGAKSMIAHGALESPDCDCILGLHVWPDLPVGTIGLRESLCASSDTFKITVKGKGGHGAHPYRCVDPIVAAAQIVLGLQTIVSRNVPPTDPAVVTVAKINAGTTRNIIPEEAVLEGTLRAADPETRELLHRRLNEVADLSARTYGAEAQIETFYGAGPVLNNPDLLNKVRNAASEVIGADNVKEIRDLSMGADDFAEYQAKIPGVYFRLGTHSDDPQTHLSNHNPSVRYDEEAIMIGARVLFNSVIRILETSPASH